MPKSHSNLRIVLGGGDNQATNGRGFVHTLVDFLSLLEELDKSVSGVDAGTIVWEVLSAQTSSPMTVEFRGRSKIVADYTQVVVNACMGGMEALESGLPLPSSFNQPAASRLFGFVSHFNNDIALLKVGTNGKMVSASDDMLTHIQRPQLGQSPAVRKGPHREYGDVEGRVETVSSHSGYYFNLWEIVSDRRVKCTFPMALREKVRGAWERRAIVTGEITFGVDGEPQSIVVEDLILKSEKGTPPLFKDTGIDITNGIESSAYIRGLRDDD